MSIFELIIAFGVTMGFLAILVVVAFDALRRLLKDRDPSPMIPKTMLGGFGIGGIAGPGALIARAGQNASPHTSLDFTVMTPTRGLRFISLGGSAAIMALIWNPAMVAYYGGNLTMHLLATGLVIYSVLFISGYEVRYNGTSITAPNWLFQDKHYPWEEFISIKDDGHYQYRLRFERGQMPLQKHLVGMPTFITFVSEVREMNKRR